MYKIIVHATYLFCFCRNSNPRFDLQNHCFYKGTEFSTVCQELPTLTVIEGTGSPSISTPVAICRETDKVGALKNVKSAKIEIFEQS